MKKLFQQLQDKADVLAQKWVKAIEESGSKSISSDHAARAVRDLLGPLVINGKGEDNIRSATDDAVKQGYNSSCFNGCRELFNSMSQQEIAENLGKLAELVVDSVNERKPDSPESERAKELVKGYFEGLYSGVGNREATVDDRTIQLIKANKLLHSLFQSSRNAVIFLNADRKIIDANSRAREIFNRELDHFIGQTPRLLFTGEERECITEMLFSLSEENPVTLELNAARAGQVQFPVEVTASMVQVADETIYHLIFVDLSEREKLRKTLEKERKQIREMSVTLKNVIKSVDQEKQEFIDNLAHNVEIELMPALDRMSRETSENVRDDYREVIEDKLRGLANGSSSKLNSMMMKLTPTEIQICKYIQAGQGTKEIAEMMNSSFETVQTHRKNIRKKLELTGKQVSLSTFLRTDRKSTRLNSSHYS